MSGWKITAPKLTDEEFAQIADPANKGANPTSWGMLQGLQQRKHVYGGTVPAEAIARNRVRNKAARKARRITRSHR
jgi:hypothetical protein